MKIAINKAILFCFSFLIVVSSLEAAPLRSVYDLFPGLDENQMRTVFSSRGLRNTFLHHQPPVIVPASDAQIDLLRLAMQKTPKQLVEALVVVPYAGKALTMLDAYNAIGRVRKISDYTILQRGSYIQLFEESTRLNDGNVSSPIPDPPPATVIPLSESIYMCLKDTYFGNTYFRGDLSVSDYGITYNLTNYLAIWYLIFPVMRAEKFATILYVEPLKEGTLIYGVVGLDIPEFLIERIHLGPNINRRLNIFINWLRDGFRAVI